MLHKSLTSLTLLGAAVLLAACPSVTCPAEFARPMDRMMICGRDGDTIGRNPAVYISPEAWQQRQVPMLTPEDLKRPRQGVWPFASVPSNEAPVAAPAPAAIEPAPSPTIVVAPPPIVAPAVVAPAESSAEPGPIGQRPLRLTPLES
jgi:hypothetical protein